MATPIGGLKSLSLGSLWPVSVKPGAGIPRSCHPDFTTSTNFRFL